MKIFTDMEYKTSPQSSCSPDWSTMFRESCNCRSLKLNSMFYGQWGLSVKCALPGFDCFGFGASENGDYLEPSIMYKS